MAKFGVHKMEMETHLFRLLERALAGEDVVSICTGESLMELVSVPRRRRPNPGFAAGTFTIQDDFNEWSDEFLDYFR